MIFFFKYFVWLLLIPFIWDRISSPSVIVKYFYKPLFTTFNSWNKITLRNSPLATWKFPCRVMYILVQCTHYTVPQLWTYYSINKHPPPSIISAPTEKKWLIVRGIKYFVKICIFCKKVLAIWHQLPELQGAPKNRPFSGRHFFEFD